MFALRKREDRAPLPEEKKPACLEAEITLLRDGEPSGLGFLELASVELPRDSTLPSLLDSLIPLAAAGADAAAQYAHAEVRLPAGKTWGDLVSRKCGDGWKMLNVKGEGRGLGAQGAIKQVRLSGPAVANIALQGAAVVVGQAYMAEISSKLDSIEKGISAIQREMEREREARIDSSFAMLRRYARHYAEFASTDSDKRQAVLVEIERIIRDAHAACIYQLKVMEDLSKEFSRARRAKIDDVQRMVTRLKRAEREAAVAFQLLACAQQVSMQYDQDFSSMRIEREKDELQQKLTEYRKAHDQAYDGLSKRISNLKGKPLAIAAAADDSDYVAENLLFGIGHAFSRQAARIAPPAMRDTAKSKIVSTRNELRQSAASGRDVVADTCRAQSENLDRLDLMYNEADAVAIHDDQICFLKLAGDVEEPNGGETADSGREPGR